PRQAHWRRPAGGGGGADARRPPAPKGRGSPAPGRPSDDRGNRAQAVRGDCGDPRWPPTGWPEAAAHTRHTRATTCRPPGPGGVNGIRPGTLRADLLVGGATWHVARPLFGSDRASDLLTQPPELIGKVAHVPQPLQPNSASNP